MIARWHQYGRFTFLFKLLLTLYYVTSPQTDPTTCRTTTKFARKFNFWHVVAEKKLTSYFLISKQLSSDFWSWGSLVLRGYYQNSDMHAYQQYTLMVRKLQSHSSNHHSRHSDIEMIDMFVHLELGMNSSFSLQLLHKRKCLTGTLSHVWRSVAMHCNLG